MLVAKVRIYFISFVVFPIFNHKKHYFMNN